MWRKKKDVLDYVSKRNSICEKQVIFLMIPNGERCKANIRGGGCHYLTVKQLSALLIGITSKNNDGFHCLNCSLYFRTKIKLECHKRVEENKDFCNIAMPSEDNKILELSTINQ